MRRIVMFNHVSADGFFASADGNLDWVSSDPELDKASAGSLGQFDTMLLGRRTYEMFESFWPKALDDSGKSPDPHHPGASSPQLHAIAVWINEQQKLVVSGSRRDVTWNNSRILPGLEPGEIEALKNQAGRDIIVFGSGSVVSALTQHGLIDEYQFIVNPIILGNGRTMISGVTQRAALTLIDTRSYESGKVMLRLGRAD